MLGHPLTDQQVILALDVLDNRLVHLVATDTDRFRVNDAGQGNNRHLGGAAADIDDHVAACLGNRKPGADCSRHRLFNKVDLAGAGRFGRFLDRPLFHLGNARRNADNNAGTDKGLAVVDLVNESTGASPR